VIALFLWKNTTLSGLLCPFLYFYNSPSSKHAPLATYPLTCYGVPVEH
jgi:hypothetical protein